jgi:hypothetical protein
VLVDRHYARNSSRSPEFPKTRSCDCSPLGTPPSALPDFGPYTLNLRVEDRELLEHWGNAVRKNRQIPALRSYYHLGKFDHRSFERRFGPWSKLPEVFRNFARGKPEWADVLALLPAPRHFT